jgi:MSHA pilin protein MshD
MCTKTAIRQRGVTLIELIMFIMIVGIALAGIIGLMNFTARNTGDPVRRKQALMIAEGLLEEVELAQFTYCEPGSANADTAGSVAECLTPERFGKESTDSDRPYDNVNDYGNNPNAFYNSANQLADVSGNPMNLPGYAATVTINTDNLNGIPGGTSSDPNVLRITITVTYDGTHSVTLDGYRTRYAPNG